MIENVKWFLCGTIVGMGTAAIIVATNKKVQKKINDTINKATDKAKNIKEKIDLKLEETETDTKKPNTNDSNKSK